jgi:hypothetical protein
VSASGNQVVIADDRDLGNDEVRQLFVHADHAVLGRALGPGQWPTLGGGGRYLFMQPRPVGNAYAGYWVVDVGRLGRRGSRELVRTAITRDGSPSPGFGWGADGEIAVLLGRTPHVRVILDAGTPAAREVRANGFTGLIGGGPNGMQALAGTGKIGLLSWAGRLRVFETSWLPDSFSPDGRDLLVISSDHTRLGLMSVKTGAVAQLGSVGGHIIRVAWAAG